MEHLTTTYEIGGRDLYDAKADLEAIRNRAICDGQRAIYDAFFLGADFTAFDSPTTTNNLRGMQAAMKDHRDRMTEAFDEPLACIERAIEAKEAEQPGEDPRREHGTYWLGNGRRAG